MSQMAKTTTTTTTTISCNNNDVSAKNIQSVCDSLTKAYNETVSSLNMSSPDDSSMLHQYSTTMTMGFDQQTVTTTTGVGDLVLDAGGGAGYTNAVDAMPPPLPLPWWFGPECESHFNTLTTPDGPPPTSSMGILIEDEATSIVACGATIADTGNQVVVVTNEQQASSSYNHNVVDKEQSSSNITATTIATGCAVVGTNKKTPRYRNTSGNNIGGGVIEEQEDPGSSSLAPLDGGSTEKTMADVQPRLVVTEAGSSLANEAKFANNNSKTVTSTNADDDTQESAGPLPFHIIQQEQEQKEMLPNLTPALSILQEHQQDTSTMVVLLNNSNIIEEHFQYNNNQPPIMDVDLRAKLKAQLEWYFSRENLAIDNYLRSQMDNDQFVPIKTVANFNLVKKMTDDIDLIVQLYRESPLVQVDEKGEKVRPVHKRCTLILREIPDATSQEEVEQLFSSPKCPKIVSCEYAHNNSWYINFESDEHAQSAYVYLQREVVTFKGKAIKARIKTTPIPRVQAQPMAPQPGAAFGRPPPSVLPLLTTQLSYHQQQQAATILSPGAADSSVVAMVAASTPANSSSAATTPGSSAIVQQHQQPSFDAYAPSQPLDSASTSTVSLGVAAPPPLVAASPVITPPWPGAGPPQFFDLGHILALNGFQAQGMFRPSVHTVLVPASSLGPAPPMSAGPPPPPLHHQTRHPPHHHFMERNMRQKRYNGGIGMSNAGPPMSHHGSAYFNYNSNSVGSDRNQNQGHNAMHYGGPPPMQSAGAGGIAPYDAQQPPPVMIGPRPRHLGGGGNRAGGNWNVQSGGGGGGGPRGGGEYGQHYSSFRNNRQNTGAPHSSNHDMTNNSQGVVVTTGDASPVVGVAPGVSSGSGGGSGSGASFALRVPDQSAPYRQQRGGGRGGYHGPPSAGRTSPNRGGGGSLGAAPGNSQAQGEHDNADYWSLKSSNSQNFRNDRRERGGGGANQSSSTGGTTGGGSGGPSQQGGGGGGRRGNYHHHNQGGGGGPGFTLNAPHVSGRRKSSGSTSATTLGAASGQSALSSGDKTSQTGVASGTSQHAASQSCEFDFQPSSFPPLPTPKPTSDSAAQQAGSSLLGDDRCGSISNTTLQHETAITASATTLAVAGAANASSMNSTAGASRPRVETFSHVLTRGGDHVAPPSVDATKWPKIDDSISTSIKAAAAPPVTATISSNAATGGGGSEQLITEQQTVIRPQRLVIMADKATATDAPLVVRVAPSSLSRRDSVSGATGANADNSSGSNGHAASQSSATNSNEMRDSHSAIDKNSAAAPSANPSTSADAVAKSGLANGPLGSQGKKAATKNLQDQSPATNSSSSSSSSKISYAAMAKHAVDNKALIGGGGAKLVGAQTALSNGPMTESHHHQHQPIIVNGDTSAMEQQRQLGIVKPLSRRTPLRSATLETVGSAGGDSDAPPNSLLRKQKPMRNNITTTLEPPTNNNNNNNNTVVMTSSIDKMGQDDES